MYVKGLTPSVAFSKNVIDVSFMIITSANHMPSDILFKTQVKEYVKGF